MRPEFRTMCRCRADRWQNPCSSSPGKNKATRIRKNSHAGRQIISSNFARQSLFLSAQTGDLSQLNPKGGFKEAK